MIAKSLHPFVSRRLALRLCTVWLVLGLATSCAKAPKSAAAPSNSPEAPPPNIVIVLFDTLRADHVAPYTRAETHTPTIAALADSGVTFLNAYSPSSYTRTSVATLLTATNPWTHGCTTKMTSLPPSLPYLPELLQQEGYRTLGVVGNAHLAEEFGFDRGFDEYHLMPIRGADRSVARESGPAGLAQWVWSTYIENFLMTDKAEPFFLYLHEVDPHGPYEPPPPYDAVFESGGGSTMKSDADTLNAIIRGDIVPTESDLHYLNAQYRGEIAYMDGFLKEILHLLEYSGRGKNTILVFLSDHGEEFHEHGRMHHWITLYNEVLHVPLIVRFPDRKGAGHRVPQNVGLVDVAPTLLEAVGIALPASFAGRSLLSAHDPAAPPLPPRPIFGLVRPYIPSEPLRDAVIADGAKLIRSTGDAGITYELYDLAADAAERNNLWTPGDPKARALAELLAVQSGSTTAVSAPVQAIPDDIQESLRALGYVD